MKKEMILVMLFLFVATFVVAEESCDFDIALLNQEPYPAVPGEKVEVVFTISNIDTDECGTIDFEILEEYPFTVDKGSQKTYTINSGTYTKDYNTHKTIPVDLLVDAQALDGDTPLEIRYKTSKAITVDYYSRTFDVNIDDVRADFEIFVSDYDLVTKEIKFEVLNIGETDIEAVTVELQNQEGIKVYGANRENIGDLSSNEDTSTEFKVDVNTDSIKLVLSYSDSIQVRRTIEKEVSYNSALFEESAVEVKSTNYWQWAFIALIVVIILYFVFRKRKKKK